MNTNEIQKLEIENLKETQRWLLGYLQELTTAVLELAGESELRTGVNPLSAKTRLWLKNFVESESRREVER